MRSTGRSSTSETAALVARRRLIRRRVCVHIMASTETRRKMNNKIQWTDKMNDDLLECKRKALVLTKSSNPPRLDSGRKKGYMAVMKDLWETMGYSELGLSSQNLRDQAQRLEKMQERSREIFRKDFGCESTRNKMVESEKSQNNSCCEFQAEANLHMQNKNSCESQAEANLHTEDVTAKLNSAPMRPINCFVKEALISTPANTILTT